MVRIDVDLSGIEGLKELPRETIKKGMNETAKTLISELMHRSPVDHGLLKQWAVTSQTDTEIRIQSPAKYAGYVNYGHSQQPGRFIPGTWQGDKFRYKPGAKTGMVLKQPYVRGRHFVEASIRATQPRIREFFTINGK